jgi:hypothetical protein
VTRSDRRRRGRDAARSPTPGRPDTDLRRRHPRLGQLAKLQRSASSVASRKSFFTRRCHRRDRQRMGQGLVEALRGRSTRSVPGSSNRTPEISTSPRTESAPPTY